MPLTPAQERIYNELKEVRDSSAAEARAIAQQLLRDAGVQSVPKQ